MFLWLLYYHVLTTAFILVLPHIIRRTNTKYFQLKPVEGVWVAFNDFKEIVGVVLADEDTYLQAYTKNNYLIERIDLINSFLEQNNLDLSNAMWRKLIINGLCDKFEIEAYEDD